MTKSTTTPGTSPHATTPPNQGVMGLWAHLDELRSRLIKACATLLVLFIVALTLSRYILNLLKIPLQAALPPGTPALHFTGPMDVFMVNIQVSLLVALIFGAPAWLYHFWKFLEPALHVRERKYILPFMAATIVCFMLGILFSYFFMLPLALEYLVGIGMEVAAPMITITDYVSLVTVIMLGFGLVFETPVILVLLALLDIISADLLASQRRLTFIIILVISAVLTPPDPISMLGMAIPCYLMYELSILVIRFIKPSSVPGGEPAVVAAQRKPDTQRHAVSTNYPDPKIEL